MKRILARQVRAALRNRLGKSAKDMPGTVVIWAGESRLDRTPIMVVASNMTRPSANTKTGDMIQVSIMRQDMAPMEAWKQGLDGAVCPKACEHRSKQRGGTGACYVNKARLEATWKAANRYLKSNGALCYQMPAGLFEGAELRFGMEGDPSSVPLFVWSWTLVGARNHNGYTANWRDLNPAWASIFMASCSTVADSFRAKAKGWRVFAASVSTDMDKQLEQAGFRACLSDSHNVQCASCFGCNGTSKGSKRQSFFVQLHGATGAKLRRDANKQKVAA